MSETTLDQKVRGKCHADSSTPTSFI